MKQLLPKQLLFLFLFFLGAKNNLFSQNFSVDWHFANDSLAMTTGNVTAPGAYIDPTLFTRSRIYGSTGLKGTGTNGKTQTPACSALYNAAGATTPISPYMELSLTPNAGFSASLNAFSFSVTGDSITSANMVIAAGYSTDGGLTFTGFNVSKNDTPIVPNPDTVGTHIANGDVIKFSAPSLMVVAGSSLKIRLIYWKNASNTTSGNRIIVGSVNIAGTTSSTGSTPVINIPMPMSLSGFSYVFGSGPSSEQSFSVSAANLTTDLSINAGTNYEISSTSGTGFSSTLLLSPVSGAVNNATVYVRLISGLPVGTYTESISISSTGATNQTVAVSGSVTDLPAPTINMPMPMSLSGLSYLLGGGPSAENQFSVSGSNLTGDLMVNAPADYEVSLTSGNGFASSLNIAPISGSVASTIIFVRLKTGLTPGNYLETISITSSGATAQNVSCSGVVSSSSNPNDFTATWPFMVDSLSITTGNVSAPGAFIDPTLFTRGRVYGLTGLKGTGTNGKTQTPNCTSHYDSAGTTAPLINPYMELSVAPNAGYSASLNAFSFTVTGDSISSANMVIAAGYSTDGGLTFTGFEISKNDTPVSPRPDTFGTHIATGDVIKFTAPAVLVDAGASLKIRVIYWKNATGTTSGNRVVVSSVYISGTTAIAGTTPAITAPSPASLSGFDYVQGSGPSGEQSFSTSGVNLTSDITVSASTNFEVSLTSGTGFSNSVVLAAAGGMVPTSTIYIRLKSGLNAGPYNENISITSSGAASRTVACSGTVSPIPSPSISVPSPASLSGFTYPVASGPSSEQSFSISGANLTSDITVTASSNYEVSSTTGSGFMGSVTLTPASGTVSASTIYVRLKAGLAVGSYNETIAIASTGANPQSVSCSGNVTDTTAPAGNFTAIWPFVTDTLATTTGNVNAPGAFIHPTLFSTSRTYGITGLTGAGTTGLANPTCSATYDSVSTITPYMEMVLRPNTGYSASLLPFSFKITAGTISSANMVIAAGYSTDGGVTFTGFNITKNGAALPLQETTGTPLATNDSLVLSAPALHIAASNALVIRIIYWKNNNSTTSNNPITIGAVSINGTTAIDCSAIEASVISKSLVQGFTGANAVFVIAGVADAVLDYNINGGSAQQVTLTGGNATILINNISSDQTLNLLSITKGSCVATLHSTSTIALPSAFAALSDKITVYPNPAINDGKVSLKFKKELTDGVYAVRLCNAVGQVFYASVINHTAANSVHALDFGSNLTPGNYQLQITNNTNSFKIVKTIVVLN